MTYIEKGDSSVPEETYLDPNRVDEPIEPEVVQGSFPAPFRSKIGNSTVDLSDPKN